MSNYRSELTIPVEIDHRSSFKEFQPRENLNEGAYTPFAQSISDRLKSAKFVPWYRNFSQGSLSPTDFSESDGWFREMRQRFDNRRKKWDEDVRRMRQEFFTLDPVNSHSRLSPPSLFVPRPKQNHDSLFSSSVQPATDGSMFFAANFDVSGFRPEEIQVSVRDNELTVTAKSEKNTGKGKTTRGYTRSVKLPEGVEETMANATVTIDGILTFSCPLKSSPCSTRPSVLKTDLNSVSSPNCPNSAELTTNSRNQYESPRSEVSDLSGLIWDKTPFRLELPIGSDYSPAEIHIRTLSRRIYVTARHEERQANRTAVREISKEYDIPIGVDPECLEAKLENGILYIAASSA